MVSNVFRKNRKGLLAWNGLIASSSLFHFLQISFMLYIQQNEKRSYLTNLDLLLIWLSKDMNRKILHLACCTFLNYFFVKGVLLSSNKSPWYYPLLASIFSTYYSHVSQTLLPSFLIFLENRDWDIPLLKKIFNLNF